MIWSYISCSQTELQVTIQSWIVICEPLKCIIKILVCKIQIHIDMYISGEITIDLHQQQFLHWQNELQDKLIKRFGKNICHQNMQGTHGVYRQTGWKIHLQVIIFGDDDEILLHEMLVEH